MSVSTDPEIPVDHIDLGLADAHFQDQEMTTVVLRTSTERRVPTRQPSAAGSLMSRRPELLTSWARADIIEDRDTVLDRDKLLE